jgi:serpin B
MATSVSVDATFSKAANDFAIDSYTKATEGQTGSFIFSPASIQQAVTLASFGAAGDTKTEMLSGLKYPVGYKDDDIAKNCQVLNENVKKSNYLKIANKVYLMKDYTAKEKFNQIAKTSFSSESQTLDFSQSVQSADTINKWVEDNTNNKIKDLVQSDSLGPDTRMVLVNAIYFKGFWTYQFDPKNTFKGPFYLNDKDTVTVDFMKIKKNFKYGSVQNLDATAIELPYKDSDITMLIILPNSKTGLPALESKLKTANFDEISKGLYSQEVNVELPKFKIETELDLKDTLTAMGMGKMFTDQADFSALLNSDEKLKVSKVVHKAFIEVNEEGAEAAAATGVTIEFLSLRPDIRFKADHSFFFALKSGPTKLFIGRVNM